MTDTAFWQDRAVLVTGASGFLGTWMVPALIRQGAKVLALARGSARSAAWRQNFPVGVATLHGSVTDFEVLRRAINDHGVDTIFHLAAQPLVGPAMQDPAATLDVNVRGTWTVLEAARVTRQCQVLVASSEKAYSGTARVPYAEDMPTAGQRPYDVSKSCADLIAVMYASTYDLPVAIARCGNLFGGGDINFSRGIAGAIRAALRGEPLVIRSDGRAIRDYLYVEDAIDAYLALAEMLAEDRSLYGEAFNFALEERMTLLEVVDLVLRIVGRTELRPVIQGIDCGEAREQYSSAEKARRILGWRPKYGIAEGLARSIRWYRQNLSLLQDPTVPTAKAS